VIANQVVEYDLVPVPTASTLQPVAGTVYASGSVLGATGDVAVVDTSNYASGSALLSTNPNAHPHFEIFLL
jgi:hypothetical protein